VADILALHADGVSTVSATPGDAAKLTLRSLRTRAVEVPLRYVLGTSAATVRAAPLLAARCRDRGRRHRPLLPVSAIGAARPRHRRRAGRDGRAHRGEPAAPLPIAARLERLYALIGVTGVVRMALSVLDMALWDARAVAAGLPLATLLGGRPRPIRPTTPAGSA
jgi:mandelate racemase